MVDCVHLVYFSILWHGGRAVTTWTCNQKVAGSNPDCCFGYYVTACGWSRVHYFRGIVVARTCEAKGKLKSSFSRCVAVLGRLFTHYAVPRRLWVRYETRHIIIVNFLMVKQLLLKQSCQTELSKNIQGGKNNLTGCLGCLNGCYGHDEVERSKYKCISVLVFSWQIFEIIGGVLFCVGAKLKWLFILKIP